MTQEQIEKLGKALAKHYLEQPAEVIATVGIIPDLKEIVTKEMDRLQHIQGIRDKYDDIQREIMYEVTGVVQEPMKVKANVLEKTFNTTHNVIGQEARKRLKQNKKYSLEDIQEALGEEEEWREEL